ncbi:hypothetical protein BH10BAC3_BH10BAC3_05470 [soil metagenome]
MSEEISMNENINTPRLPQSNPVKDDPFYIGWMAEAPKSYARQIRKALVILAVLVPAVAIVLAFSQKNFSTSSFEFGQLTTIKGIYLQQPFPSLKVISSKDIMGNFTYITIPLVGYGKFGAGGAIAQIEKQNNISLNKKLVTLKGSLLYSDGKTLLQVDVNDHPLVQVDTNSGIPEYLPKVTDLGMVNIRGEVLDPKCYFGVMKPGHGKPHRDCAIRCLLGGISPVFYVRNAESQSNYYLILGEHGEKINEQLRDFVADPVKLEAHAIKYDDWIVLYVNPSSIQRISTFSLLKNNDDEYASCGK